MNIDYFNFLLAKTCQAETLGFDVDVSLLNPALLQHQAACVPWLLHGGRRALFASFGLGKTIIKLEAIRIASEYCGGRGLIVIPLGVRQEFRRDAVNILGWTEPPKFIRSIDEADPTGVYLTNYETVRDGKLDPRLFDAVSLDEASILRGLGGTKTFREFMRLFAGDGKSLNERIRGDAIKYRFVATATPSPNDYIELLAYAAFLGVMDVSAAKTRFFKRNSEKADQLTIHEHKKEEFWLWVASWALFITKPSDIDPSFSDNGYDLPVMNIHWHEIASDHGNAGTERDGQGLLFNNAAIGVTNAAREKRQSLELRIARAVEIIETTGIDQQWLLWCDLNDEQQCIEKSLTQIDMTYSSLTGSQHIDLRETLIEDWRQRKTSAFVSKPMMYGSGINMQQCCKVVFVGIGFKAQDIIQAVHRVYRFGQTQAVDIHFIYTEAEREVRRTLERKWQQHNDMVNTMTAIVKEFGLSRINMLTALNRGMGVQRMETRGDNYLLVNNDCVVETQSMTDNSIDLIVTSIPFSTQYEYSPNFADFGHSDNNAHFFKQMDFLTPHLLRVLKPGRVAAIHVKDRIVPGGMTGLGFQTVYPFHAVCIDHYVKHGFGYMGMKTIVTDVVRENNQTYRLGWTEQCKDGTKMGVGMPEYLLLFRKPPTDTTNSYADMPVVKSKAKYSRARWQVDAHGFTRSSGNRQLAAEDLIGKPHNVIFKLFREYSLTNVYDFEHHVKIGEALDVTGILPTSFMLLQPQSWMNDVWSDITRMLTLNGEQYAKGKEMHLCPLQFDIVDRVIEQFTMPGETVYDPFGGLCTVPYRAILKGRKGIACELSTPYFLDGAAHCKAAENKMAMPDLFAAIDIEENKGEAA